MLPLILAELSDYHSQNYTGHFNRLWRGRCTAPTAPRQHYLTLFQNSSPIEMRLRTPIPIGALTVLSRSTLHQHRTCRKIDTNICARLSRVGSFNLRTSRNPWDVLWSVEATTFHFWIIFTVLDYWKNMLRSPKEEKHHLAIVALSKNKDLPIFSPNLYLLYLKNIHHYPLHS